VAVEMKHLIVRHARARAKMIEIKMIRNIQNQKRELAAEMMPRLTVHLAKEKPKTRIVVTRKMTRRRISHLNVKAVRSAKERKKWIIQIQLRKLGSTSVAKERRTSSIPKSSMVIALDAKSAKVKRELIIPKVNLKVKVSNRQQINIGAKLRLTTCKPTIATKNVKIKRTSTTKITAKNNRAEIKAKSSRFTGKINQTHIRTVTFEATRHSPRIKATEVDKSSTSQALCDT
jgi:hypothetical protein